MKAKSLSPNNVNISIILILIAATPIFPQIASFSLPKSFLVVIFSSWVLTLTFPILFSHRVKLVFLIAIVPLYFIYAMSYLTFDGILSTGAFGSIMDSKCTEIMGYLSEFGAVPLVMSILLTSIYIAITFRFSYTNKKTVALFWFIVLIGFISLFIVIFISPMFNTDSRVRGEFKSNPMGVLSHKMDLTPIAPIFKYLAYIEEESFVTRPTKLTFPDNISYGMESKYDRIYLILGESASSRHFSFYGYPYETTPFLDSLKKHINLYTPGPAISPAPITRESIKRVMSFATVKNPNYFVEHINIIKAAELKGFETYWFANQGKFGVHDSTAYKISLDAINIDFNAKDDSYLPSLISAVKGNKKFIVAHLSGSHSPYLNYEKEDYDKLAKNRENDQVIRYDATINKTDSVIKKIIENIPINSIVIYISDHGEVVGKGHGLARPSKDQFDVPFFIYDNSGMNEINAHHILSLSNGEVFNTQYIMDFITKLLGYDIGLNNREDPYQVYFSNGEKLDYKSLPDHYN
ncbi:phosphoethanolamine transferase [Pseudomonadales bacterium]|nr:phosphoethanolamine transferase [Pseudomonadales bacterium]